MSLKGGISSKNPIQGGYPRNGGIQKWPRSDLYSENCGIPKLMVYNGKSYLSMDDLGVTPSQETSKDIYCSNV